MTNEELKKKIVEVVLNSEITGIQIRAITGGYSMANNIADALIAAGIGDVSERKALISKNEELRKRLKKVTMFTLNICGQDDCAGNESGGVFACTMWNASEGCLLKKYLGDENELL